MNGNGQFLQYIRPGYGFTDASSCKNDGDCLETTPESCAKRAHKMCCDSYKTSAEELICTVCTGTISSKVTIFVSSDSRCACVSVSSLSRTHKRCTS